MQNKLHKRAEKRLCKRHLFDSPLSAELGSYVHWHFDVFLLGIFPSTPAFNLPYASWLIHKWRLSERISLIVKLNAAVHDEFPYTKLQPQQDLIGKLCGQQRQEAV